MCGVSIMHVHTPYMLNCRTHPSTVHARSTIQAHKPYTFTSSCMFRHCTCPSITHTHQSCMFNRQTCSSATMSIHRTCSSSVYTHTSCMTYVEHAHHISHVHESCNWTQHMWSPMPYAQPHNRDSPNRSSTSPKSNLICVIGAYV